MPGVSVFKVDCRDRQGPLQRAVREAQREDFRRFLISDLHRTADDFDETRVSAADCDENCRGLWQGKPLYFNGDHCSRLWKMTSADPLFQLNAALGIGPRSPRTFHLTNCLYQPRRFLEIRDLQFKGDVDHIVHRTVELNGQFLRREFDTA
jgi:hypothetical protein